MAEVINDQFIVKVEGETFNCQSSAFLQQSDFFKTLISGPFKENGTSLVELDNSAMVSASSFRLLMDMMTLPGTNRIQEESVNKLVGNIINRNPTNMNLCSQDISKLGINTKLDALYVIYGLSKYFGMNQWLGACEQWWTSHVHMRIPNAMETWKLSQQFEMPNRMQQSHFQFILKNFERIVTYTSDSEQHHVNISESIAANEDFFQLDLENLLKLLKHDDLAVPNEKFVLDAAVKWCRWQATTPASNLDEEEFNRILKLLLPSIRFGTLKPDTLEEVEDEYPFLKSLAKEVDIDVNVPSNNFRIRQRQTRDMIEVLKKKGNWKGFKPVYIDIED